MRGSTKVKGLPALKKLAATRKAKGLIVSDYEICYALQIIDLSPKQLTREQVSLVAEEGEKLRKKYTL